MNYDQLNGSKQSGVVCSDSIQQLFEEFKITKTVRFYTYKIVDKKVIEIDVSGPRDNTYEDFCKALPPNEGRYGLIDLEFTTAEGRPTSKLVFVTWNPDTGSIREKMLYSTSKEAMKAAIPGVGIHINATDPHELDLEESIMPVCRKYAK